MNRGCFREVFDAVRATLVAVGEHTASRRKDVAAGPHDTRGAVARVKPNGARGKRSAARFSAHPIAFAAWCAFGVQPCTADAQPTSPITPDRSVPGAPAVGVAANGVPLVHIAKANGAGVSHNRFMHYNVGTSGVVLNNSGTPTLTYLAGRVGGNPFLGNGHARVILNEVTSGNPSRLLGITEVAGRPANVVIANPAGIYCNGCGFINAPRATLVTGVPVMNGLGDLTGLTVLQGALTVDGKGLDARGSSQLDLIARAMRINGRVWAGRRLTAVAGENRVDYSEGSVSATKGGDTGATPLVAIDVAALGGMYANTVRLVSTERGVGVNLEGVVNSLTGDIHVSSSGDVTIARDGALLAAQNARFDAASVRNAGAIAANGAAMLVATNTIDTSGTLSSRTDVIGSARTISNTGLIAAGTAQSAGNLKLTAADALSNRGVMQAARTLTLKAATVDLSGGTVGAINERIAAADETGESFDATDVDTNRGVIRARSVSIDAAVLNNDGGNIVAIESLTAKAGTISNQDGQIESHGTLEVLAEHTLSNEGGEMLGKSVTARAGDSLINIDGHIESAGVTQIDTATLVNEEGKIGGAQVRIDATDALKNSAGKLFAQDALDVKAGTVSNFEGEITSSGKTTIATTRELNNREGVLTGTGDIDVKARALINEDGEINAIGGVLKIRTDDPLSN